MRRRQKLPKIWLMTDERLESRLFDAIERLPMASGIVFRHYSLAPAPRRALFEAVKTAARARHHGLLLAGPAELADEWGADGSHGRGPGSGFRSAPVHGAEEMRRAMEDKADLVFLSPVFPTRSHPGAPHLGPTGFARLARQSFVPVIALGGMNAERARDLEKDGAYGWAAIDAWATPRAAP